MDVDKKVDGRLDSLAPLEDFVDPTMDSNGTHGNHVITVLFGVIFPYVSKTVGDF